MKKIRLVVLLIVSVIFTLTSCKKDKKAEHAKEHKENVTHKQVEKNSKSKKMATLYQCPMDCEKGKSYTKPGKCPVCKMDLKPKKVGEKLEEKKQKVEGTVKDATKKVEEHIEHSH